MIHAEPWPLYSLIHKHGSKRSKTDEMTARSVGNASSPAVAGGWPGSQVFSKAAAVIVHDA